MSTQPQPPKTNTYTQPKNPISQTPLEQQDQEQRISSTRYHGDNVPAITRDPQSKPSNSDALSENTQTRKQQQRNLHSAANVDTEYGVEQQPAEGDIAARVEGKSARAREQAGAHAGPVGSMLGPGCPAIATASSDFDSVSAGDGGELRGLGRKREKHDRMLGERVGQSPAEPDGDFDGGSEREEAWRRKLEREEDVDVGSAVREGPGSAVVR
ncbi:hypothetical protein BDV38DRAFT_277452 [Aspergillus pseudotamarii]|uniref:Uncharacterized protein n=1 Tax=Aspergillus pseudotamarii TaxID=132259 RepID=A0A5N6TAY1_ASPPS|nr:uncharacterized protein BDV38DRAFT_277452 [Aspergillus pseudotamarii]KAE8143430.1 hypothetical protein BDV38DRAFT_277452 [Aspergillus pseudotamarii]